MLGLSCVRACSPALSDVLPPSNWWMVLGFVEGSE
uniref:Uncharacterized protein n=1 Tax=Anguilla anguilla TaxID=7936 RepID=A0A0E9PIE5_ANGAN